MLARFVSVVEAVMSLTRMVDLGLTEGWIMTLVSSEVTFGSPTALPLPLPLMDPTGSDGNPMDLG